MSIVVKRADSSSYFPPGFEALERSKLEEIPGVKYLGTSVAPTQQDEIILLTNTHTRLQRFAYCRPQVKALIHPNSGFDNLAPDFYEWKHLPIVLGNSIRAQAVAEWTLSALFQHFTPLRHHGHWPSSRAWPRPLIRGTEILLIGYGHVGKILEVNLRSLGAKLSVHDPFENQHAELKSRYAVVILAASLNPSSHAMLGSEFFKHAAPDLLLINPARGELIDEKALRDFLSSHPQARAVLDVHALEPYPADYWSELNVTATPHIAGVSETLINDMLRFEVEAIKAVVGGLTSTLPLLSHRLTQEGFLR